MAESLKVIHVCDHTIKTHYEELKSILIDRQEIRKDEAIDCRDSRLIYFGNWAFVEENINNKYYKSSIPGNILTMNFYGDNIRIYGRKIPDGGKVKIKLDGENIGVLDLYSELLVKNELIFQSDNLIYGAHSVQIELISEKNPSSMGSVFVVESALIKEAIITELSPYDSIPDGEIAKQITYIHQDINGKITKFVESKDYLFVKGNKIRWIGLNRPHPSYKYSVEYIRKYSKTYTHKPTDCPRCYGLGWYGAFNDLITGLPSKSLGIYRIAEDIIKILLTPLREDDYGSEFVELNKELYVDTIFVEDTATSEINRIERYYKRIQAEEIAKGATYTPEDTLYAIIVDNVNFNEHSSTLTLEITVYNNAGKSYNSKINI